MSHPPHIQQLIDQRRKRDCPRNCHCGEIAMYRVGAKGFCEDHKEDAVRAGKNGTARWVSWAEKKREDSAAEFHY